MSPMGPMQEIPDEFERRARILLEEGVSRIDGRIRSRLNQARHAALAQASVRRSVFWRYFTFMPAAGAVAGAVLVAVLLWPHSPASQLPLPESARPTVEDMDLLADGEALDLVSDETDSGAFYEWAVDQTDTGETHT
ncbi:MAG TPA: hypothetical protein VIY54_11635 [Steroidobacteraceae bacterium]